MSLRSAWRMTKNRIMTDKNYLSGRYGFRFGSRESAVGSWQWAVGSRQWAVGSRQWAVLQKMLWNPFKNLKSLFICSAVPMKYRALEQGVQNNEGRFVGGSQPGALNIDCWVLRISGLEKIINIQCSMFSVPYSPSVFASLAVILCETLRSHVLCGVISYASQESGVGSRQEGLEHWLLSIDY